MRQKAIVISLSTKVLRMRLQQRIREESWWKQLQPWRRAVWVMKAWRRKGEGLEDDYPEAHSAGQGDIIRTRPWEAGGFGRVAEDTEGCLGAEVSGYAGMRWVCPGYVYAGPCCVPFQRVDQHRDRGTRLSRRSGLIPIWLLWHKYTNEDSPLWKSPRHRFLPRLMLLEPWLELPQKDYLESPCSSHREKNPHCSSWLTSPDSF